MQSITPYLNFNGNAGEALEMYIKAFNGQIVSKQHFSDTQMPVPDNWKDKVMHAIFAAGDMNFMVSDTMPDQPVTSGTNTSLALNFDTVEEMEKVFTALSDGAAIVMPLQDTFWGARFGILTDKFGINWMFNHDYEKK